MACTIKDIQNKQYEMLLELDRICKKNNIKYYLAQGTLLGAARHKGFIPWDDDIDTIIPADELDKLMKVFSKETTKDFLLTNHKVEGHYQYSWAKIRADHTLSRPKRYKQIPIHWGICLDLFPLFPLSDNAVVRKIEVFWFKVARKMLLAEMTRYDEKRSMVTRLFEYIPIPIRHWFFDLVTNRLKKHGNGTKYVFMTAKGGHIMERNIIFGKECYLQFEGQEFPVPADYDTFLRLQFGDYMTPPPVSEQGGHDLKLGEIEWSID